MTAITAPSDWVEEVSRLKLPPKSDRRLQQLMDRNNDGSLTEEELAEMESLVEMSEALSLVRARALGLLGRTPR
jgi:hypothetical protein